VNSRDLLQLLIYLAALAVLGEFLVRELWHEERPLPQGLARVDSWLWRQYLGALMAFNALGILFLLGLQMAQASLPLNPAKLPNGLACIPAARAAT
jgi:K+-transporting ATPase A subunit